MLDDFVLEQINQYAEKLENKLAGDVIYYYGPTHHSLVKPFRDLLEKLAVYPKKTAQTLRFSENRRWCGRARREDGRHYEAAL